MATRRQALFCRDDDRSVGFCERQARRPFPQIFGSSNQLRPALEDIRSAYDASPIEPGILQGTRTLRRCSEGGRRATDRQHVPGQRTLHREKPRRPAITAIADIDFDWSWRAEKSIFVQDSAESRALDSTGFMKAGIRPLPFGMGRHAPIAAEDQARKLIANILITLGAHAGKIDPAVSRRRDDVRRND